MSGDYAVPHILHRGSDVEAWLKRERDQFQANSNTWCALDDLLDAYRLMADTGEALTPQYDSSVGSAEQ